MAETQPSKPIVSIIVTTYNRSHRLKGALSSIQDQTFEEWECIVVDDCSPDDTEKVVQKFMKKDPRFKYFRRSENFGNHSRPKNDGSRMAVGEFIAYLDDDNIWYKDHLMALYHAIKDRQDLQMVYGDRRLVDEEKRMPSTQGIAFDWHPGILQTKNYIDTSDVLIRKYALEALGGWDEGLRKFADWNLFVRFAKMNFKAERVPLILSEYRLHAGMAQLRHKSLIGPDGQPLPTFEPSDCKIYPEKTSYPPEKPTRVAIITISWHRLDYLKETVASMKATADYAFDHYIVLNEATDDEQQWARENATVVLPLPENEGCPRAYNTALNAIAKGGKVSDYYDMIILTDNDVTFKTQGWLAQMVDLYSRQRKLIVSPYVEGLRDNPGGSPRVGFQEAGIPKQGYVDKHFLGFVRHMGNIVQMLPAVFFDDFRFDEDTFKHGTQSFQISGASYSRGYAMAYMENLYVEHMKTTAGQEKDIPEYFAQLKKAKQEKPSPKT